MFTLSPKLRLTLDGSQLSPSPLDFTFHDLGQSPRVISVGPDALPLFGGNALTIVGSNLLPGAQAACVFSIGQWHATTLASVADAHTAHCDSPPAHNHTGTAAVRLWISPPDLASSAMPNEVRKHTISEHCRLHYLKARLLPRSSCFGQLISPPLAPPPPSHIRSQARRRTLRSTILHARQPSSLSSHHVGRSNRIHTSQSLALISLRTTAVRPSPSSPAPLRTPSISLNSSDLHISRPRSPMFFRWSRRRALICMALIRS